MSTQCVEAEIGVVSPNERRSPASKIAPVANLVHIEMIFLAREARGLPESTRSEFQLPRIRAQHRASLGNLKAPDGCCLQLTASLLVYCTPRLCPFDFVLQSPARLLAVFFL